MKDNVLEKLKKRIEENDFGEFGSGCHKQVENFYVDERGIILYK